MKQNNAEKLPRGISLLAMLRTYYIMRLIVSRHCPQNIDGGVIAVFPCLFSGGSVLIMPDATEDMKEAGLLWPPQLQHLVAE